MVAKLFRFLIVLVLLAVASQADARTYLVAVGVGDYTAFPGKANNLQLTVNDAKTIVDLYSKNTPVDYSLLLDKKATRDRIIRAIGKLGRMASPGDILVFFFSGHGFPGGLCAYDGNITYADVRKAMAKSKARNKMMFVDACRSGGMRVDAAQQQHAVSNAKKANVMLFLSSRNTENSIERPDMTNGYFTSFLQKGLKGEADANRDRVITAREIFDFVHTGVAKISGGRQHPVMWGKFPNNMPVMQW